MATVINNPNPDRPVIEVERSDSSGWVVAVIVLLAVIVGGFLWWTRYGRAPAAPVQNDAANIEVTVPIPGTGGNTEGESNSAETGQ
jgi:hypothetical protein